MPKEGPRPQPTGPRRDGASSPGRRRRKRTDGPRTDGPRPAPAALPASAAATPPGQALERLRARVLDTVREIERLRLENDTLAARLAELDADAARGPSLLPADGDPEALRRQIEGFVDALDALLTDEAAAPVAQPL